MASRLDRVKNWALLAKASRYSASAIAYRCGVSPRQLERYFQEHMKKSPHQWLRELRLGRALELIQRDESIKQVAQELCYKDTAHFCRDFKNYFGRTPGQHAAQECALQSSGTPTQARVAFQQ